MLTQILLYLIEFAFGALAFLALLRAWASATAAPMRNPIGQFVMKLTDFAVLPLRKILPRTGHVDLASLLLAYGAALVMVGLSVLVVGALNGRPMISLGTPVLALIVLLRWSLYLLIAVLIVQAIMSWTNPHHPAAYFAANLVDPMLRPIRRFLPPVGGFDLSPIVLIVLANIGLIVVNNLRLG